MDEKQEVVDTLAEATRRLVAAKDEEKAAQEKRINAEMDVAAFVPAHEDKKSQTVDSGVGLKVTVTRGMNYGGDVAGIQKMLEDEEIPAGVAPLKWSEPTEGEWMFDAKAWENIIQNHEKLAAKMAPLVQATPKKVAVSLKVG